MLNTWKCMLIVVILILSFFTLGVFADEQSLGRVRIASFTGPRQVAPASTFSMSLDIEYEVRTTATIRAAIFGGLSNASAPLWQSEITNVTGGGDKVWTSNFTAPPVEGTIQFSAYAYYLDNGVWKFYNDPILGPGYSQVTIKVSQHATLQIDMGVPRLAVTLGNNSDTTTQEGDLNVTLAVGVPYSLSVPSELEFQNSTRIVFNGWQDGSNQSQRMITLTGDMKLVGSYREQYLLIVTSTQSSSPYQKWCDIGSNVTLQGADLVPASWFLTIFGGRYVFSRWSGDVNSRSNEISLTMNSPKTITANFSIKYGYLIVFPIVIASGIVGEAVLLAIRRKKRGQGIGPSTNSPTCPNCGEVVEEGWEHCIHCGNDLGS